MEEFETGTKRKKTSEHKEKSMHKSKASSGPRPKKHGEEKPFVPKIGKVKKRDAKAAKFVSFLLRSNIQCFIG